MVIIELNEIHPLDVLLTAGEGILSDKITFLQSIVRGGRRSDFSHASLFISPFLIFESLNKEGIVFSDLFSPNPSPHGPKFSKQAKREQESGGAPDPSVFARMDNGKIRIFAKLDGVKAAQVKRYKPLTDLDPYLLPDKTRTVLDAIPQFHLLQYPALAELAETAPFIPKPVIVALTRLGRTLENKIIPGPFCSSLVVSLLSVVDPQLADRIPEPNSVAPSDISYDEFYRTVDVDQFHSLDDLPGVDCADIMDEIRAGVEEPTLKSQAFKHKLKKIQPAMELLAAETGDDKLKSPYKAMMDAQWRSVVEPLKEHARLSWIAMELWANQANKCFETCPASFNERTKLLPGLSETFTSKRGLRGHWERTCADSERCPDVRYCSEAGYIWANLTALFNDTREERLKADLLRSAEMVRSME